MQVRSGNEELPLYDPGNRPIHALFLAICRNFDLDNEKFDEEIRTGTQYAFVEQDEPMVEALQEIVGDREFWSMKPALLQGQHTQIGNQTNVFLPASPADGVLPAANLGKITLSLTPRVFKQIEGQATREPTDSRMLDSIEMLGIKDIQTIGNESNNGDEK